MERKQQPLLCRTMHGLLAACPAHPKSKCHFSMTLIVKCTEIRTMLSTDSIQIQDQLPVFSLGLGNIGIEIEKAEAEQAPA